MPSTNQLPTGPSVPVCTYCASAARVEILRFGEVRDHAAQLRELAVRLRAGRKMFAHGRLLRRIERPKDVEGGELDLVRE